MKKQNPRCRNPECKERFNKTDFKNPYCPKKQCQKINTDILNEKERNRIDKQTKKALKNLKKIRTVEKQERKDSIKTKSDYEAELQVPINKIARLIDKGSSCMMCNNVMKRTNGCHYHSRGANTTLRFHLYNIWIGCHSCNSEKGGNIIGYDNRLIEVYDREKWEYIKFDIVRTIQPLHLTIDELKQAKIEANKIVRELEKLDMVYPPIVRWTMRHKYNLRIGIYKQ
jgi:hypothetical protein